MLKKYDKRDSIVLNDYIITKIVVDKMIKSEIQQERNLNTVVLLYILFIRLMIQSVKQYYVYLSLS